MLPSTLVSTCVELAHSILLTDDAGSRELAQTSVVSEPSGRSWVQELERHNPGLSIRSSRAVRKQWSH
jgi:hypothetical protein